MKLNGKKIKRNLSLAIATAIVSTSTSLAMADSDVAALADTGVDTVTSGTVLDTTHIPYAVTGGYIYYNQATGEITKADKYVTNAVIPAEINGVKIVGIGERAFAFCQALRSVTLPEGLQYIGYDAFYYCWQMAEINVPTTVTSIDRGAFECCCAIKSITLPEGITAIEDYTFNSCTMLSDVNIPSSVTSIGYCAFEDCTRLEHINIPDSVREIGGSAFNECSNLKELVIPDGVKVISQYIISGCTSLVSITIPASVTEMSDLWQISWQEKNFIIRCYKDSCAQDYAVKNDIPYVLIDDDSEPYSYSDGVLVVKSDVVTTDSAIDLSELSDKATTLVITGGAERVSGNVLSKLKNVSTVYIAKGVQAVADNVFNGISENAVIYNYSLADVPTSASVVNSVLTYGDVSCDNILAADDAAIVLQKVLDDEYAPVIESLTSNYMKYCDVTGDGILAADDAASILQKVLDSDSKFPIEN